MPAVLRIDGLDDMDANLEWLGQIMKDRSEVEPILIEALAPVAERARGIVPVRTGRLQRDILVGATAEGEAASREPVAYVGPSTDAFYAEDVEFGRPASVGRSGREHPATRAHPFMRPAWDVEVGNILHRVGDGLARLIKSRAKGR